MTNTAPTHPHDAAGRQQPPPSQTSSSNQHHPLEPVSGKTLFEQESRRRDALWTRGHCATGSRELDDACLAGGGFERGCVVGISVEDGGGDEENVGLVMGLQTIGRMFAEARAKEGVSKPRAMIISTMAVGALVGVLREVVGSQIVAGEGDGGEGPVLRDVLERIDIARVFDVPGLWEVLGELDRLPPSQEIGEEGWGAESEEAAHAGTEATASQRNDTSDQERRDGAEEAHEEDMQLDASAGHNHKSADDGQPKSASDQAKSGERDTGPSGAVEPPSSPLSDPPSSLPDELPWDTADVGGTELLSRTPPGQREVIQDSEEEGFSSSASLARTSPETSPVKVPEPVADDTPSPPVTSDDGPLSRELTPARPVERGLEDRDVFDTEHTHEKDDTIHPETSSAWAAESHVGETSVADQPTLDQPAKKDESTQPDIILITHMSTLMSSLLNQRERATAHEMLQLLASHLRYLTRAPEHGGPLIILLNSTTSAPGTNTAGAPANQDRAHRDGPRPRDPAASKPLDPTLRSIFNPPPLLVSGLAYALPHHDTPQSRRNKPSFGLVFSQMLDLHLLCTRVPKTRADAEALYAPRTKGTAVGYAWAVEVLLDEIGVWEGRGRVAEGKPRRSREQRWGAVELRRDARGVRIVDAFAEKIETGEVKVAVAAGFGGRRV